MDILCPKCGEPWDMDELHNVEGLTFQEALKRFQSNGCEVFNCTHSNSPNVDAALLAQTMYEILGDDIDGAAGEFADYGY